MKNKREVYRYLVVIFGCILIVLILAYMYLPKNCEYSSKCLDQSLKNCERSNSLQIVNGNTYFYQIKASWKEDCNIKIKVLEVAGADLETKQLLDKKDMFFKIPKNKLSNLTIENVNNILDYCTGTLKESMLELMIKRLYEVIVSNIGPITVEMQNSFNKTR